MLSNLKAIFSLYGGWRALRSSSYLYYSILINLILWRPAIDGTWVQNAIDLLPPVLGFSIAGLAIITAMGDQKFRENMAKIDTIHPGESDLTIVVANFCWFVFIQIFATIFAIGYGARPFPTLCLITKGGFNCDIWDVATNIALSFFGQFLMVYGILLMLAAVFQMMNIFRLYLRNL